MKVQNFNAQMMLMRLEMLYAAVVLFALTIGPVYTLWRTAQTLNPSLLIDSSHLATFVVVQLPALYLLGRRFRSKFGWRAPEIYLFGLMAWIILTSVTSDTGAHAVPNAVKFSLCVTTGLYLAISFNRQQQLFILTICGHLGVTLSLVAISRDWVDARYNDGEWSGVYVNPNLLGPVAAVALIALLFHLGTYILELSFKQRLVAASVTSLLASADLIVLWHTSAFASSFSAGAAIAILVGALVRTSVLKKETRRVWHVAVAGLLGIFIAVMIVLYRFSSLVNGRLIPESALQARIYAWQFSWTGFLERPWLGWGQLVAWSNPNFRKLDKFWTVELLGHGHSAYLEVLLSGGFLAAVLLVVYLALSLRRLALVSKPGFNDVSRLALIFFCLTVSLYEPFIATNYFLWPVLIMMLSENKEKMLSATFQRTEG